MSLLTQKTLRKPLFISGIGIHKGKKANLKLLPALPNTGISFKRVDLKKNNIIQANYKNVSNTMLCTTISNAFGASVSTIEHLMGALYGIGIDNLEIEIDTQEVPIMDGSAKFFIDAIKHVGIKESDQPIKILKINRDIKIEEDGKFISISKSNITSEIEFEIKYKNPLINIQKNKNNIFEDNLDEVFNSRTFCLYEDIEKLKKLNLGKGGTLDNAVVVKDNKVLNPEGLRNNLEFVNHKILDCMGDLFLSGYRIIGSLNCSQGGHYLTNKLLRKVFDDVSNYSLIEIKGKQLPHVFANYQNFKTSA